MNFAYLVAFPFLLSPALAAPPATSAPAVNRPAAPAANSPEAVFAEAEKLFLRDDLEGAIRELNQVIGKQYGPVDPFLLARARNLRGLSYFQMKNLSQALADFEAASDVAEQHISASDPALHLARYNLANTLFQLEQDDRANGVLASIDPRLLDQDTRIRYYNLLGSTLLKLEKNAAATIAFLVTANELEQTDSVATEALVRKAYSISKKLFSYNALDELEQLDSFESRMASNGQGTWALRLIMARGYSVLGRRARAEQLVQSFLREAPQHPLASEAAQMNDLFQKLSVVEPTKIGVLVPLSGNFSKFGQLSLNSALLALNAYEENRRGEGAKPPGGPTIVIRDSGETVESSLKAFDELTAEDHVVAVIGPLLSRQAVAVAQKAQEYGVPLFSLSQKQGLERVGSYVFPIALTPSQQIKTLIHFTMKERGFKRFAILAPDSPAGDEYVRLFWDQVEENGGAITGIEKYDPRATDFRGEIRKILGLHYMDARKLEMEDTKRREDTYASRLKVRGVLRKRLLQNFSRPKPVIDFDGIFIPDGPQAIGQIAPSFAIYDVKQPPFLGINTWNTPDILRRAGQYLQNSYFVDSFYPTARAKSVVNFVNEFQRSFGTAPGTLEVQAYDATKIIIGAIESGSVNSRSDLISTIQARKNHTGISGKFQFGPEGLERSAYLLGVKGSEILEIMPPTLVK